MYPHQAQPYIPAADPRDVLVGVGLMRAVSRGRIAIDAAGDPIVRLGHLTAPADRRAFEAVLADAASYIDDMVAAGVFIEPPDTWWRGPDALTRAEERKLVESYGHLVGTCRMGADEGSVVDQTLALRGIAGASVVDASIMPISPRANTMLATFAIARHGADLVRERVIAPSPVPIAS